MTNKTITEQVELENAMGLAELTVRTIDSIIPEMTTDRLQKWHSILRTALAKTEKELTATSLHTCQICFLQEWGYRDELPIAWYGKGDAEICFQHEYADSEKLLKDAGFETDAFLPPDIPNASIGSLKVGMDNLPPPKPEVEATLEELMNMI